MLLMKTQKVILLDDLRVLGITCTRCNTKIDMDLTANIFTPAGCPCCQEKFDSVQNSIYQLKQIYLALVSAPYKFTFTAETDEANRS